MLESVESVIPTYTTLIVTLLFSISTSACIHLHTIYCIYTLRHRCFLHKDFTYFFAHDLFSCELFWCFSELFLLIFLVSQYCSRLFLFCSYVTFLCYNFEHFLHLKSGFSFLFLQDITFELVYTSCGYILEKEGAV
jgi:hypothetical protein